MADAPQASAPEETRPERSRRQLRALAGGILLLAGAGLAPACGEPAAQEGPPSPRPASLHLEPLVLNLADAEGNRYLRVAIDIVVDRAEGVLAEDGGTLLSTRLRDRLLIVLASKTADDVVSSEGKEALRAEVRRTAEPLLEEARVLDVYFTEFRVQ